MQTNQQFQHDVSVKDARVVGFIGYAGSGKTTASLHLCDVLDFKRERFADPLKRMMREFGLSKSQVDGDQKEIPTESLCGRTPRHALQTLGTEWGRVCIDNSIWLNHWSRRAKNHIAAGWRVVCDDVRFPNEAEKIIELGGVLVMVHRHDAVPNKPIEELHVSERIDLLPRHLTIQNDGSIEEFRAAINKAFF